jgi:hypothetical protein
MMMRRPRWLGCAHLANGLFALLLSGFMSLIVSGISSARALGFSAAMPLQWAVSWLAAWAVALPIVLVLAPRVRRIVEQWVKKNVAGCG